MNKTYNPPKFSKVIELLLPLELPWGGQTYTIDEWRRKTKREVQENRRHDKIKIFNRFVSALLEGFRARGEEYDPRIALMNKYIHDFSAVTTGRIQQILAENHYPLPKRGLEVILSGRKITEPSAFQWEQYFCEAENKYESGYMDDVFLKIKGVGKKVRDFALSEFSLFYCAIDRHLADVIRRTGLLLYGYGQPDFGTSPTKNYEFLQRLLIQFSKQSEYSPKEIDTMLWFFSNKNGICKGRPECSRCPIKNICLTFRNRME